MKLLFTVDADVKELDLNTGNVTASIYTWSAVFSIAYDHRNKYLYIPRYQLNDILR